MVALQKNARAAVRAFDVLAVFIVSFLIAAGTPDFAYAYVDPSVMTYTVQAVAGVAVALSAVVGVAFRRTRKWLFERLGVDPDAKRVVDERWVEFEEPGEEYCALGVDQVAPGAAGLAPGVGPRPKRGDEDREIFRIGWFKRFLLALLVSFMTAATLLFVAPVEIVAGSGSDFAFTPQGVAPLAIIYTLVVALVVALAISLLRGKAFFYALAVVFAVGVGFFAQAMFLNRKLPIADGSSVDWARYDKIALVSAAAWVVIVVASVLLVKFLRRRSSVVIAGLAAVLIVVQGIGMASILLDTSSGTLVDGTPAARKAVVTEEGLFDVGKENNVIVFVLDTYDTADFKNAIKQEPSLLDGLTGFTWYDNVCGAVIPTRYGVPFLLTNERPREGDTWQIYLKERYNRSSFLSDLTEAGYSNGLYTTNLMTKLTSPEIARNKIINYTLNVSEDPVAKLDTKGAILSMTEMALYRDLPWVLKPRFLFDTDDVVADMIKAGDEEDLSNNQYKRRDAVYYQRLQSKGLTIKDRGSYGTFRFIHLTGDHEPYVVNANGESVKKGDATRTDQAVGTLKIAEYYLEELKKLGLYESSTVIFTADHGHWKQSLKDISAPASPFILLKPSQTEEESQQPMATSHAPVMHDDVVPTIIDAIGGDPTEYSGKSLFRYTGEEDPDAPRLYLSARGEGMTDYTITEYAITGDVLDFDNWSKTGKTWDARE